MCCKIYAEKMISIQSSLPPTSMGRRLNNIRVDRISLGGRRCGGWGGHANRKPRCQYTTEDSETRFNLNLHKIWGKECQTEILGGDRKVLVHSYVCPCVFSPGSLHTRVLVDTLSLYNYSLPPEITGMKSIIPFS